MDIAPIDAIDEVTALLERSALPTADLSSDTAVRFFGIRDAGELVAVIGLEAHPPAGLLRSLAVAPGWRRRGLAHALVSFVEAHASAHGMHTLFLLTTTAEAWFRERGYAPAPREPAPAAIRATAQFSGLCPAAAAFLAKPLAGSQDSPSA
jgi:amino-acid N-acetyltransferase